MSQQPLSIATSTLPRQNSSTSADIKLAVKDYIDLIRPEKISEENQVAVEDAEINDVDAKKDNPKGDEGLTHERKRHMYLPPLADLEAYVLENNGDNFLNILPDVAEAIASYVKSYPDQTSYIWECIKPVLKEMRKRNRLHGRLVTHSEPPKCPKKLYKWTNVHGEELIDHYAWLTEKDNPEVMKQLLDENRYSEQCLAHTKTLQKVLFNEFISRSDENAESARVTLPDGWVYYSKKIPGAEYRMHCRMDKNGFEDVYLDENKLCLNPEFSDPSFFRLGFLRHSPDCQLVAYGIDFSGSERYTGYFLNLESKESLEDAIPNCYEDFEFSNCGKYVFYIKIDDYGRAYQLMLHEMGTSTAADILLYEEPDEMFFMTMTKSCNKKYILINTSAQVTSETRIINMDNPLDSPRILFPRREHVQYTVEHHSFPDCPIDSQDHRGHFYVTSNENSRNIQLFRISVPTIDEWKHKYENGMDAQIMNDLKETVIENRDFVLIEGFQIRARHLIVFERSNCVQNIRILNMERDRGFDSYHYVSFSESSVYSLWPGSVDEEVADLSKSVLFDTNLLRYTYTSFTQPKQVVDYNMDTRSKVIVHEERVMGPAYDRSLYSSKRLWATGTDGTAIPISIVYRKDLLGSPSLVNSSGLGIASGGSGNPTLLHAYGAYGYSLSPIFSTARLSLLDRGFIYAVAHVRGGSEMGNAWYAEGKLAKKPNTFSDFISCAEYLIKEEYTSTDKLAIYGRSAGGLLIGAVVNMRPDLFKAVLTEVPFVDVINTMFDTSIPWTAFEFEEWGNPEDEQIYSVMKSYCPYSNVSDQLYPNMLIVGGMNDPRVAYFEPAKWTAKLREVGRFRTEDTDQHANGEKQMDRMLLLKIQEAGHGGSSGQYSYLEDVAFEYAFLISTLGAPFKPVNSGGKDLSLNGVDYETYWQELDKDNPEDEEEDYGEEDEDEVSHDLPTKPSTPLQRFSDYWKKRAAKSKEKKSPRKSSMKEKPKRNSKSHSRAGSVGGVKGLFKGLSKTQVDDELSGNTSSFTAETQGEMGDIQEITADRDEARDRVDEQPATLRMSSTIAPRKSPSTTPGGSKASLRQQLYPHEDESGRVQSTSRVYGFLSKFF